MSFQIARLMRARWFLAETPAQGVAGNPHSFEIEKEVFPMKKQEIRNIYTQKAAELLAQGYTIFPDTMRGHQGEIAHIDFTNGSEILRLLLYTDHRFERDENGYYGDTLVLMVGKAAPDTRVYDNWDGSLWNQRLEPRFQIEWATIGDPYRGKEWYTTMEEGRRIQAIQRARFEAKPASMQRYPTREALGEKYKAIALKWLRRQPRMKTCHLEDIEKMERVTSPSGERSFEIKAKGKTFSLGK